MFIARTFANNSMNLLTRQLDGCTTRLTSLHNLHQLQQPGVSETQEPLSPSSNSLNFVLTAISSLLQQSRHCSQTFTHGWHTWGPQIGVNLWQQDLVCKVGDEEQSIRVFQACVWKCVFFFKHDFSNFCGIELSWNASAWFQRVWITDIS